MVAGGVRHCLLPKFERGWVRLAIAMTDFTGYVEIRTSGTQSDDGLDLDQGTEVEGATWNHGTRWTMLTKERRTGAVCLGPMRDIAHVDCASDDVVDLRTDDATNGLDVSEREHHLVGNGDPVSIRSFAGHAELARNVKGIAV
jgi:hypothetical protein